MKIVLSDNHKICDEEADALRAEVKALRESALHASRQSLDLLAAAEREREALRAIVARLADAVAEEWGDENEDVMEARAFLATPPTEED